MTYYTLLGKDNFQSPWEIVFGDYYKGVVQEERQDNDQYNSYKIIVTEDDQYSIDKQLEIENRR